MGANVKHPGTGLTVKQEAFALECVRLGSPARAYRKVYEAGRLSQAGVWAKAHELLQNVRVKTRIAFYTGIADKAAAVTVEKIARELFRIAFFDPRELFDGDGNPIPINELPDDAARVIAGLDVEKRFERGAEGVREHVGNVLKYKIANKLQALEVLAKWKQMLVDRHEIGKPGEFANLSDDEVRRRAEELAAKLGVAPPKLEKVA